MKIVGIDPGLSGALVSITVNKGAMAVRDFTHWKMPLNEAKEICYSGLVDILKEAKPDHVWLERAKPMAMGAKHAFNYGRGFMTVELAIKLLSLPVTYIEPEKWGKIMHEGISADLKPKARSFLAVARLFPTLVELIPKNRNGKMDEGIVEALLIAGFGHLKHKGKA